MSPFWPGAHYSPDWASSSWQSSCLWLPSTKITSIDQHSQLQLNFCIPCPEHSSPPTTLPVALPQGHFPSSSLTLCPVVPWEGSRLDFLPYVSSPPSTSCSLWQFYYDEFLRMSLACLKLWKHLHSIAALPAQQLKRISSARLNRSFLSTSCFSVRTKWLALPAPSPPSLVHKEIKMELGLLHSYYQPIPICLDWGELSSQGHNNGVSIGFFSETETVVWWLRARL